MVHRVTKGLVDFTKVLNLIDEGVSRTIHIAFEVAKTQRR